MSARDRLAGLRERIAPEAASRVVSAGLALGTGTVLGLAMWLEPSPTGHSTHLQLGLSPCSFLTLTGIPCPMCGATTTFALMAHLRWLEALVTQPFAVLLFLMTVCTFGISVAEVVSPRRRWSRLAARLEPREGMLAGTFLAAMAVGWAYKVWSMSGGS